MYSKVHNHPSRYGHSHTHHHSRRSHQADTGVFLMFAGLLLGSPFLVILGYFEYMTAPMLMAANSAMFLGLSTLSLSALVVYGSIGVAYMFSGARECYSSDHGPLDLLKSRVTDNGLVSTLGAILWSPFLFVGGVAGATAKAVVNVFSSKSPSNTNGSGSTADPLDDDKDDEEANSLRASSHSSTSTHSHHSQHEHPEQLEQSSDEEDHVESPLPVSGSQMNNGLDTPLRSSTESVTHSVESTPSTEVRLPLSKSQEGLGSYNRMVTELNVKPVALDDSHIGQVPVTTPSLLRQPQRGVSTENLVQEERNDLSM